MPNPFDTAGMAAGYAHFRPPVHPRVIELARPHVTPSGDAVERALDVGSGAGLSTRPLSAVAGNVYGIEPAEGMVRLAAASVAPEARFVVGSAEGLPFSSHSFSLIAAAGSLNYVPQLGHFFDEAARVLAPGGSLLVYDFSQGRQFHDAGPDGDPLSAWFERFVDRYPQPARQARPLNPAILGSLDRRFRLGAHADFALPITLTGDFYLEYMLTETNVAKAVERGETLASIREWCRETLAPVWQQKPRAVVFRGYYACLTPA